MAIQILDTHLINKIAAGEVIERPASIVKELVENAIDAGSTRISVSIEGGGMSRIEVEDDGCGMSPDDLKLAFERHATSKILSEEDLYALQTMGFRGEALPSIASVSRVEVLTRQEPHHGVRILMEGGVLQAMDPYPTAVGTRISVRDLFFNTPARRKFLKSPVTEGSHIYEIMTKLALSHPDVSFTYANERKRYFKTPGNGELEDVVAEVYGVNMLEHYLPLNWQGDNYKLQGLISCPELRKHNRKNQIFFVNQRLVRNPVLTRAMDEAYRGLLLSREYPAAILFLSCPPESVDVNVHPQKSEVKFQDDQKIFRIVFHAIKDILNDHPYQLDEVKTYENPASFQRAPDTGGSTYRQDVHVQEQAFSFEKEGSQVEYKPTRVYSAPEPERVGGDSSYIILGQFARAYILVEKDDSLFLVDQHAAHERIRFNQIQQSFLEKESVSQILVFPLQFELTVKQMDLMEKHRDLFTSIGFELEPLGPESMVVRSAPRFARGQEITTVTELLEFLEDKPPLDFFHHAFATMACKGAVKAGQVLSVQEMENIIRELLRNPEWKNCPHGRPTVLQLSREELDRRFKR